MMGSTFILRIEGSYGFWSARVRGQHIDKVYVPFAQIVCA